MVSLRHEKFAREVINGDKNIYEFTWFIWKSDGFTFDNVDVVEDDHFQEMMKEAVISNHVNKIERVMRYLFKKNMDYQLERAREIVEEVRGEMEREEAFEYKRESVSGRAYLYGGEHREDE